MSLVAIHKTFDFRGDHEAEIEQVFAIHDGETVEDLWDRVRAGRTSYSKNDRSYVELRWVEGS